MGYKILNKNHYYFDTLTVKLPFSADDLITTALEKKINLRKISQDTISLSLDETVLKQDVDDLLHIFAAGSFVKKYQSAGITSSPRKYMTSDELELKMAITSKYASAQFPNELIRKSSFLTHQVFNSYHSVPFFSFLGNRFA